jgi:pyruvate-formate lyase-activating enzyme
MLMRMLTLELTERCNIRCAHCMVSCQPGRGRDLAEELVDQSVEAADSMKIPLLSLSGGEPLLARSLVARALAQAASRHIPVRLVTNGSWARTDAGTRRTLAALVQRGLTRVSVSADPYHQQFVPLDHVHRLTRCAREIPVDVEVNLVLSRDDATLTILEEVARWDVPIALTPLSRQGRARALHSGRLFSPEQVVGCPVVAAALVDVEGAVNLCCNMSGPHWRSLRPAWPLQLAPAGRMSVATALAAHDNPVSRRLAAWGPIALATLAARRRGETAPPVAVPCEACMWLSQVPERVAAVAALGDEELAEAVVGDEPTSTGWADGEHRFAGDARLVSFPLSGHLCSAASPAHAGDAQGGSGPRPGHVLTFKRADGSREFLLLDPASAEEVSRGLLVGALSLQGARRAGEPVVEWVRRHELGRILIEAGALGPTSSERGAV